MTDESHDQINQKKNPMKKKSDKVSTIRGAITNYASRSVSGLINQNSSTETEIISTKSKFLPIGQYASYTYDVTNYKFIDIDPAIQDITGISAREILEQDVSYFLSEIIVEDYLDPVVNFVQQSLFFSKKYRKVPNLSLNLEYSIVTRNKESKRLLCQFQPHNYNAEGYPLLNKGSFVDVTHIRPEGLPILYVVANNQLVEFEQPDGNYLVKNKKIPFTAKEMNILKLTADGKSIKDIADTLQISISTVYTHRKNIKSRTDKDLFKIISELRAKGIL
jgi:hypothetical protein